MGNMENAMNVAEAISRFGKMCDGHTHENIGKAYRRWKAAKMKISFTLTLWNLGGK